MRPKNEQQRIVLELSRKLPDITPKQRQWAIDKCFEPVGYFCKDKVWCQSCGEEFEHKASPLGITVAGGEAVCPKCGKRLKLENSRKRKDSQSFYFTILTTFKGYQVCRHFVAKKSIYKVSKHIQGCQEPTYSINEAVQNWIDQDGNETILSRPTKYVPGYYDIWNFEKPMAVRSRCSSVPEKYEVNAYFIYPHRSIMPKIKRNGFTGRFYDIAPSELFKGILKDHESEMLLKNGQIEMLKYKCVRNWERLQSSHAIRIANKNRYIIKDPTMWIDYLALLQYFHLDTHNAHYVCPDNLKAEHDRLMKRKERVEARIKLEKNKNEAVKWEQMYRESKGRFFGVCFGNEDIIITVIRSVAEMAEEGDAMHHCVYSSGYFKKSKSLILSAKDKDGNRIETIELDIETFKVIQSRGKYNSNTKYHEVIMNLVQENINIIRKAA